MYPILGQYGSGGLRWLAQDEDSPIARHRQAIFNYLLERNDLRRVVAVRNAAKESVVTWVRCVSMLSVAHEGFQPPTAPSRARGRAAGE